MDQRTVMLRTPSPNMPGKGITYGTLQWDALPGWVSYFAPLGKGNFAVCTGILLYCCMLDLWKHIVPVKYVSHRERGEDGGLGLSYPTLIMPDSAACPSQHVWYA